MVSAKKSWHRYVKNEISRICATEDLKEMKEALLEFKDWLDLPAVQKSPSGKFYYFYFIESVYSKDFPISGRSKKQTKGPPIGKILKSEYEKNKDEIETLRVKKDVKGLKKYLTEVNSLNPVT